MIYFQTGDLFKALLPDDTILHGVNCQGVAAAGFAAALRAAYPDAFTPYFAACQKHTLQPGGAVIWTSPTLTIIHCATQEFYGRRGRATVEWIERSLTVARSHLTARSRAAMPRIGGGLGGLNWQTQVLPIVTRLFQDWPGTLVVYTL
jgi:O-acetyl-ADP-ribose deacetylase (regulator of RNase III)